MREKTKDVLYVIVGIVGILFGVYGGYVSIGERAIIIYAAAFGFGGLCYGIATGYQHARAKQLGPTDEIVTQLQGVVSDETK